MGYSAAVMSDSPAGYWRLGEASGTTAADETGFHDGTYNGVTLGAASLLIADADTSVSFDGVNDYVTLGIPNTNQTLSGWTWEVWLNTEYQDVTIPGIFGEDTFSSPCLLRQSHETTTWDLQVRIFDGTSTTSRSLTGLPYDTTMHLVVTVEDAQTASPTVRVYRDGAQVTSWSDYGTTLTSPYRAQSLGTRDTSQHLYLGRMDEAAFYTSALSAARVEAHYDAGVTAQLAVPTGFTFAQTAAAAEVVGSWTAVTDADTYDYEVQEWNGSAWQALASAATTHPTVTFTLDSTDGVTFSTLYRSRVRAVPAP